MSAREKAGIVPGRIEMEAKTRIPRRIRYREVVVNPFERLFASSLRVATPRRRKERRDVQDASGNAARFKCVQKHTLRNPIEYFRALPASAICNASIYIRSDLPQKFLETNFF